MDLENPDETRSPLRFLPSHLQIAASRRKGKGKLEDTEGPGPSRPGAPIVLNEMDEPGLGRKPLPAALLATLMSEASPQEHEMHSEAQLQRLLHSRPSPLTPRVSKSSRGRFPEMADNDDEDDVPRPSYRGRSSWTGMRMNDDTDSDEDPDQEPVNGAFAADMDLDRAPSMSSASSSAFWPSGNVSDSEKVGPSSRPGSGPTHGPPGSLNLSVNGNGSGQPTPPPQSGPWAHRSARMSFNNGNLSSPGGGLALPGAFGTLGFGGGGTPLASPTLERLEVNSYLAESGRKVADCLAGSFTWRQHLLKSWSDAIPRVFRWLCVNARRQAERSVFQRDANLHADSLSPARRSL